MTRRSGSAKRQRTRQVSVRLTDEEYGALSAAAAATGLTMPGYLRYAFAGWTSNASSIVAVCGCGAALYGGVTHTCGQDLPVTAVGGRL